MAGQNKKLEYALKTERLKIRESGVNMDGGITLNQSEACVNV